MLAVSTVVPAAVSTATSTPHYTTPRRPHSSEHSTVDSRHQNRHQTPSSQLTAHSSQLTAHSSQLTAHSSSAPCRKCLLQEKSSSCSEGCPCPLSGTPVCSSRMVVSAAHSASLSRCPTCNQKASHNEQRGMACEPQEVCSEGNIYINSSWGCSCGACVSVCDERWLVVTCR